MDHLLPPSRHQPGQFQQVAESKRRPASRQGHHRVGRDHVGPTGGHADKYALGIVVVDPILAPAMADRHQQEDLAGKRMEWMRDTESPYRVVRTGCS